MALRDIEPFLNLSHPFSRTLTVQYTEVLSNWNIPYIVYGGDTSGYGRVTELSLTADGWLLLSSIGSVSGNRRCAMGRNLQSMGINVTDQTVAFGGARMKFGRSIPSSIMTTQGSSAIVLLSRANFPNVALNTEFYVEWCIDMPNSLFRARVDGVEVPSVALNDTIKSYLKSGLNYLMWGTYDSGSSSAMDIYLKDGYVLEKTPDGQMSGWLGPQTVKVLPVAEFNGPWTASSGTPLEVLNTPIASSADRITPLVASDPAASEATLKFDASSITGLVKGVSVNVSMRKQTGRLGALESTINVDGSESSKSVVAADSLMAMYTRQLLSSKTPSGGAWSGENLGTAIIKLKPVNV
ncbi:hypothetical protein [Streptomyces sp. CHB9.2]|uniref:hypothetical protein n=1 Tax=Streptomyces sp. CHB9.2 TaxID=2841670 RepID=UPI002095E8EC|nr:hypothetical protein [Streptomyces sp. CHB9.2]MCO6704721.1 hypothetical protein [Streptomyces sp. CHB9.2]